MKLQWLSTSEEYAIRLHKLLIRFTEGDVFYYPEFVSVDEQDGKKVGTLLLEDGGGIVLMPI
jgi:hypothetical protein